MPDSIEHPETPPRRALGRLISAAVDLLCIVDRHGFLRWVNPAWKRLLGWSTAELKERPLMSFIHPADAAQTAVVFEALRETEDDARFVNRICCQDGSYRWLQWSGVSIRHGAIYGTARDITEEKLAAREAEERTRMLLMAEEVAGVGHWRIDLTRDSLTWSREMYRIHGLDPAKFMPTVESTVVAYHPEDRGLVADHIRDAVLLRRDFEFELRIVRPDGSVRDVLSRGKCEASDDGRPLAVFGVFQDVTERKRLQERVAQSERMATVGTLAAGVAHEINNPLTWVIANLDALARIHDDTRQGRLDDPEQLAKMIEEAQEGADQVKRIVRDLLTYSRSRSECLEAVDVEQALDIAVNIATNQIKYRAHLVRDYGHVPAVVADQSRLTQVFVNLLINAAQAIPERRRREGVIELRTRVVPDGRVCVEVVDNGLGIPDAVQARVFDPFYTTKPVGVGTGLGLSISSNIISSFHGEIRIDSEEGEGTRVGVLLPVTPEAGIREPEGDLDLERPRVLVMDRDERLGRSLFRMLPTAEYDVVSLRNGRDALSLISGGDSVSMIVCDMELADMSGLDFLQRIRQVAPNLSERVAFVVHHEPDHIRADLDKRGLPWIERPLQPSMIRDLVERLVH
ncbi:MAG: PAS domain-containing protein [Deltaproteobacteria bacterium]|nr:PAS domain-containing protein [Deltaproteobacteria bacterium]